MTLDYKMVPELKNKLKGKVLVVGVGNTIRGDDAAGPELVKKLSNSQLSNSKFQPSFMDVGEVPENYLGKIANHKADTILIVDAVDFGEVAGSIKIIDTETLREDGLSTHNASLKLTIEYLKKETKADIFLLGIQPKNLTIGSGLSKPVEKAIEQITFNFL